MTSPPGAGLAAAAPKSFHGTDPGAAAAASAAATPAEDTSPFAQLKLEDYAVPADIVAATPSPALFVFMDVVRENVRAMIGHCGGEPSRWRPHLKTTKMAPVYAALLEAGVRKFKCATPKEARVLLSTVREHSVSDADLLVSYPHVEPNLSILADLAAEFPQIRVSVLVEDAEGVAAVNAKLGIFVDVNVGQDRTGIPLVYQDRIMETVAAAARAGQLRGMHYYDGHNTNPSETTRASIATACYKQAVSTTLAAIDAAAAAAADTGDTTVSEVITSGSTTFLNALAHDWGPILAAGAVHTVSPGTIVFHDARYDAEVAGTGMRPGALVLSRVVSSPNDGMVTLDAGSKGLAAEAGDPVAKVLGHCNGAAALDAMGPSEEHLPMRIRNSRSSGAGATSPAELGLGRGTALWLFPRHICPTVNMYDQAILVDNSSAPNGNSTRTVPVDARGH